MSGIRLWNSKRYKIQSDRTEHQLGPAESLYGIPEPLSPTSLSEPVYPMQSKRPSQHETLSDCGAKTSESLATKIAKSEWKKRTQEQLRQLQHAEEERFATVNGDEDLRHTCEQSPGERSQGPDNVVEVSTQQSPTAEKVFGLDPALGERSVDSSDRDRMNAELLEETDVGTLDMNPLPYELPELEFPLFDLRISVIIPDIETQEKGPQIESAHGQIASEVSHEAKPETSIEESNHPTISLPVSISNHERAESCPGRTDSEDTNTSPASSDSNQLPASFDRKTRVRRTSSGFRKRPSPTETKHHPQMDQFGKSKHRIEADGQVGADFPAEAELTGESTHSEEVAQPNEKSGHEAEKQCVDLRAFPASVPPPDVSPDESLFSDLTSLANIFRNRAASIAISTSAEKTRSRSASSVQHATSVPDTPISTVSDRTLGSQLRSHRGSRASLQPPAANGISVPSPARPKVSNPAAFLDFEHGRLSPSEDYAYKGQCHELSAEAIPEARFDLAELPGD